MVKTFGEKYGLDKDRKKLSEGLEFIIDAIPSIHASKNVGDNGEPYNIAIIDGHSIGNDKELLKFYDSSSVIVDQCRDMIKDARADGILKESIQVKVVSRMSKKKRPYICFE